MCAKIQGDRGLNFSGGFDISDILKNQEKVIKGFADIKKAAEIPLNSNSGSALREQNLATQEALRNSRLEIQRLKQEEQSLLTQTAATGAQTAKNTEQITANRLAQQQLTAATRLARTTQTAANGSYKEAQDRLKSLGLEIKNAEGGFRRIGVEQQARIREYNQLNAKLSEFDTKLGNSHRNIGNYRSALSGIGNTLTGLAAGYVSAFGIIAGVSKIISNNSQISDSLADVRRTAELTEVEANKLLETFKGFDTRTSLKGLLDIAGIGGQIGIAKDQLVGFTRSIDQLSVVLSNEIPGGADAVATALGKINGVFGTQKAENTTVEESFNRTGSAILKLGQDGLATGQFLQDFTLRVAGVAKAANISLPAILAYGSVLEEAGSSAEVAGTSLNRLIGSLSSKRDKFFAIARLADSTLTLEKFTNVINTDANAALQLFFKGLSSGNPTLTAFNDRLDTIGIKAGPSKNAIIALAQNQEGLTYKINKSVLAYNDANAVSDQAAIKNDTLAGSIDRLNKVFENATTSGAISTFFKNIIDYLGDSLREFDKLVNSKSWSEFFTRLSSNQGNAIFDTNKSISELTKKIKDNQQFLYPTGGAQTKLEEKLFGIGPDGFNRYLEAVKKTTVQSKATLDKFKKDVSTGDIKDLGGVGGVKDFSEYVNKSDQYYQDLLVLQKKFGFETEKENKKQQTNISGITKPTTDAEKRRAESLLKQRNDLQFKIDEITRKGVRTQQTADDAEVESIRDKYVKIRQQIDVFNTKNKGKLRVDSSGLVASEKGEVQAAIDKQSNDRLKIQLAEQGKLYQQFEAYKDKLGAEAAEKRFKGEFTTGEKYLQDLELRQKELLDKYGDPTSYSEAQKQELAIVTNQVQEYVDFRKAKEDEIYASARESARTYGETIADIDREYNIKRAALGKDATAEQLKNLQKETEDRKLNANEANAYQLSGYEDLMRNYDELTRKQLINALNAVKDKNRAEYASGKITAEQLAKLNGVVDQNLADLNKDNPFAALKQAYQDYQKVITSPGSEGKVKAFDALKAAADAAAEYVITAISNIEADLENAGLVSDGLQKVIDGAKRTLAGVKGIVGGAAQIGSGLASGNPVAVVTGSIKLLTSAISIFGTKDKKLQKQIDNYKLQLDSLSRKYTELDSAVSNAVGDDVYKNQYEQINNLNAQQEELIKLRDAESDKKKKDQGKIQDYNNSIADIPNKIADVRKSIAEGLIQTNFRALSDNLASALVDAFKTGEDSAKAFDKVFENVIQNAIQNSLKLKLLDPIINQFTTELAKYAEGNDFSVIGFDFDGWKKRIQAGADTFNKALENLPDFFGKETKEGDGLKGKLQRELTETTASEFTGLTRNIYEINLKQLNAMQVVSGYMQQNTAQLDLIQINTANTAARLLDAVAELRNVSVNTRPGQTARDLGK